MERFKHHLNTCQQHADASRIRELARIHCLAKQLGLDRDIYESMLQSIAGVSSARDLDAAARRRVIAHLQGKLPDGCQYGRIPRTLDARPMLRKIGALLAESGRSWNYAEGIARRVCKRARLEFCGDADLHKIVAALMYDQRRRAKRAHADG